MWLQYRKKEKGGVKQEMETEKDQKKKKGLWLERRKKNILIGQ